MNLNPAKVQVAELSRVAAGDASSTQAAAEHHPLAAHAATCDEFPSRSPQNWEQGKNFIKFSTTSGAEPIFSHNAINSTNIYKI